MPKSLRKWMRIPSRTALLLGAGLISTPGAHAALPVEQAGSGVTPAPPEVFGVRGDTLIWTAGGRIYVSEAGNAAQELRLGDSGAAQLLRQMLDAEGAVASSPRALPHRMMLAGSGGQGFHFAPRRPVTKPPPAATSGSEQNTAAPSTQSPAPQRPAPRDTTGGNGAAKG